MFLAPTDCKVGDNRVENSNHQEGPEPGMPAFHDYGLKGTTRSRPSAPRTSRTLTNVNGDISVTATLMKRKEAPHSAARVKRTRYSFGFIALFQLLLPYILPHVASPRGEAKQTTAEGKCPQRCHFFRCPFGFRLPRKRKDMGKATCY